MTAFEKVRCIQDLSLAADSVALAGLTSRHPGVSRCELLLRLAVLRYGRDVVARAYGWQPTDGA